MLMAGANEIAATAIVTRDYGVPAMPHDALLPHQTMPASALRRHSAPGGGPICTDLRAGRTVAMAAVLSRSRFRSADSVRADGCLVVNRRPLRSVSSVFRCKVKVMAGQRRPFHPAVRGVRARAAPGRCRRAISDFGGVNGDQAGLYGPVASVPTVRIIGPDPVRGVGTVITAVSDGDPGACGPCEVKVVGAGRRA